MTISFVHEPSAIFLRNSCFNCGLDIDYSFCEVYVDKERVGNLCFRCVSRIEQDPKKYLKPPYNLDYENTPSVEAFYRATLILDADMIGANIEYHIAENIQDSIEFGIEDIARADRLCPLKENDV